MEGSLIEQILKGTGLPQDLVSQELYRLLQSRGLSKESITIEELREVLAEYLQDVFIKAKEEYK